jgi:hypothetical protein
MTQTVATDLCVRAVPGAQYAVISTVAELGSVGHGVVGPGPDVRAWAAHAGSGSAVACTRFLPRRHLSELWAVSASGARVLLAGMGGLAKDRGPLTGASFD